jgi:hypothetical protein
MATNRFTPALSVLSDQTSRMPGGSLSNYTTGTLQTLSATPALMYSTVAPGYLSLTAFLDAAASGGAIDIYLGPDDTYPKYMSCSLSGGECKTPIPTMIYSKDGWSVYGTGDGTNYIHFGYSFYNAYGAASSEINSNVDNWLRAQAPTLNQNGDVYLDQSAQSTNTRSRPVIKFDLTSLSGVSRCSSAIMQLTVYTIGTDPLTFQSLLVTALLSSWSENSSCWNNRSTGVPWDVAGAVGGADARSTPAWSGDITVTDEQKVGFDLTDLVNEWLSGSLVNNGIVMHSSYINSAQDLRWHSRDGLTASKRPKLNIVY